MQGILPVPHVHDSHVHAQAATSLIVLGPVVAAAVAEVTGVRKWWQQQEEE